MANQVQIALQPPQAGQDPAATLATAAAKMVRASLDILAQQAGQQIVGKVLAPPPGLAAALTQIAVADQVLTLRLSSPLPPEMPVRIAVEAPPNGPVTVTVQPRSSGVVPAPVVAATTPAMASPTLPNLQTPVRVTGAVQMAPTSTVQVPPPALPVNGPAPAVSAGTVAPPVASPPLPAGATSPPRPAGTVQQPTTSPAAAPAPVSSATPAPVLAQPTVPAALPPVLAQTPAAVMPAPPAVLPPAGPLPTAVTAQPAGTITVAAPATKAPATTMPAPASSGSPPAALPAPAAAPAPGLAQPAPAVQVTAPQPSIPVLQTATASGPSPTAATPSLPPPAPAIAAPAPAPAPVLLQRLTGAFVPPPVAPQGTATPGTTPSAVLAATTQAAARQQSVAPLMQALAVHLPGLPRPVAEAAERVLANRISLDRGAPSGEAMKSAVLRSGVFAGPPMQAGSSPDLRQALTQLRGALLGWLDGEIAPIAPISRRPPPPQQGATPRAQAPELPPQQLEGNAREAGKALLNQTEGALSRVRLMQLATQPGEARPGMTPVPSEWSLELPMMIGHELAMVQMQIGRDGKGKSEGREKSWRLRFALRFSVVGEVGAQVTMVGGRTSAALWAEEPETAEMLESMLPELSLALAAKGIELGALAVRRGAPRDAAQPAGRLMDSRR